MVVNTIYRNGIISGRENNSIEMPIQKNSSVKSNQNDAERFVQINMVVSRPVGTYFRLQSRLIF